MHALRQDILPPSGVEFATSLKLTPSTLGQLSTSSPRHEFVARALCNVVVARSNLLRIFELREEPAPLPTPADDERERKTKSRRGTEAVEGEVEMDQQGEGFVNIAKSVGHKTAAAPPTITRLFLVREHRLHGYVTGLDGVKTMGSYDDKQDRLLVSFKDAKIALLEWSDAVQDLITVSIHTYERAPQLTALDSPLFRSALRVDPLSRCAALSLPKDAIAILPFIQTQVDLDVMDHQDQQNRDVPYSPSFILDLPVEVDHNIHNVIDFTFLPGFNNPTIALLYQSQQTWTGRLKEYKDTTKLIFVTLDLSAQSYPIITSVEGLPYDCNSLLPCSTSLGGVVVIASNCLIYVDQSSRRIVLPVNGWMARVSDLPLPQLRGEDPTRNMTLEGCRSVFVDDKTFFIVLKDGTIYPVEIIADGKTVSKLTMASALARTTIPSAIIKMEEDNIFVGSSVGPSVVLRAAHVEEEIEEDVDMGSAPAAVVPATNAMLLDDDDDDIYGPSKVDEPARNGAADGRGPAKKKRTVVHMSISDSVPAYGPVSDLTFSLTKNGDRYVPELVAATGSGSLGGFTLFQRDLPIRTKRKVHILGGARGMWSLPIRQSVKTGGISYEKPSNPFQTENDTLIISTDSNPSPGVSRIARRSGKGDVTVTTRIPDTTVGCGAFFQRTAILQVMTNAIRVLEPDGTERQIIKDMDGNVPRPKIKACSICDPFVLIFREDDTIGLFIGEMERGKIRRKDMSPMGEKSSRYLSGCFFVDSTRLFESQYEGSLSTAMTSTVQSVSAGSRSQWLILLRPQGIMEIWTLPKLNLAFSCSSVATLQNVLTDAHDPPAPSPPQDPARKPQEFDIEQVLIAPLGESAPTPHLFLVMRSGHIAVYEICSGNGQLADGEEHEEMASRRTSTLGIKFVKALSRAFEIQRTEEGEKSIIAEQKRISRSFVPFTTTVGSTTLSGIFFTGDNPHWILATDKGGLHMYPSGHNVVHTFTACSLWESKSEFLVYTDEGGPSLIEWIPEYRPEGPLPHRSITCGRPYSNLVFDPSTQLIVAASSLQARFTSYDEDGNRVWESDASNISDPICDCSTLELLTPEIWITLDGFEFATNEFVNDIAIVTLETSSTETGTKEYIAVGTTINRGEDLAAKGCTYIFEIVEVVPDPSLNLKRCYKLKLRCRDDAKGPVTAVCGFQGYLVSSMGQKIFVRAFDSDERLVGVAFFDVGVYVTSLRTLKNLLLVGDAVKSVWVVVFQEDPYKLILLAKDTNRVCVTRADFFFADGELAIVTGDEDGILRVYEYNPLDPESRDGRHLLLRTEFHEQCEFRTSILVARRTKDDPIIPQARLITGSPDGSISDLVPVDETAFKRLQLLQGQLTRNIQHVAGLNPRAFRIVRNDTVSKPLSKGVLDGNLLRHFEALPITRQHEITKEIGIDRHAVIKDWIGIDGSW
ncbi:hypothetical protein M378DRAFT_77599 [Amanita muscaria Koide BX008]|uniref:DNA damage-binding protein 1 n=1 Tax=Amanita muscaria (strain Koide BX008) TaxID=946122 RepID=A0A0C2SNN9_AMAMK|nr:hypothetical protein M378DRAFT_77599 [Amanita muscaria Koide BX008]